MNLARKGQSDESDSGFITKVGGFGRTSAKERPMVAVSNSQAEAPADRAVGKPGPVARLVDDKGVEVALDPKQGRARPQVMLRPGQKAGASRPNPAPAPPATPTAQTQQYSPDHGYSNPAPQAPSAQIARPAAVQHSGPRKASLFLTKIDPWSVMKSAFMLSVAIAVVMMVAVAVLWWTLASAGVFDALTKTANDVAGNSSLNIGGAFGFDKVMGATLVLAAVEIILVSAFVTLFGYLYNLMVHVTGGLELTLSQED